MPLPAPDGGPSAGAPEPTDRASARVHGEGCSQGLVDSDEALRFDFGETILGLERESNSANAVKPRRLRLNSGRAGAESDDDDLVILADTIEATQADIPSDLEELF